METRVFEVSPLPLIRGRHLRRALAKGYSLAEGLWRKLHEECRMGQGLESWAVTPQRLHALAGTTLVCGGGQTSPPGLPGRAFIMACGCA